MGNSIGNMPSGADTKIFLTRHGVLSLKDFTKYKRSYNSMYPYSVFIQRPAAKVQAYVRDQIEDTDFLPKPLAQIVACYTA
jgi:hypothetical protein